MTDLANIGSQNQAWARIIVDACLAQGVDHFFVAPGSRCTPLTVAIAETQGAVCIKHLDERGLAFACQGYARGSGRPAAFLCTSGTAVANALPAVVEASMEGVPMLLLTADRPPELRCAGANQSIDQQKLFGDFVAWYFDLPCPTEEIKPEMVKSTLDYAADRAKSGPVHINCMFREPFGSSKIDPGTLAVETDPVVSPTLTTTAELELSGGDTLVIAGNCDEHEALAAKALADRLNVPFLADITSGLRGLNYDLQLIQKRLPRPQSVIHVGGRITSKRWWQFVEETRPAYLRLTSIDDRLDPVYCISQRIVGPVAAMCEGIQLKVDSGAEFCEQWQRNSKMVREVAGRVLDGHGLSEPMLARCLAEDLPENHGLFLGNSMPIRDVDNFAFWPSNQHVEVEANRGASGIDGVVASTAGFAVGRHGPVTLLVGDLALLHDLNSLALVKNLDLPVVIVVINNDGGGIFHFLPIAESQDLFEDYFGTPHGFVFEDAAKMFEISYGRPTTVPEFQQVYRAAVDSEKTTLIEVATDRRANRELHRKIEFALRNEQS